MMQGVFRTLCCMALLLLLWAASVVWFALHITNYSLDENTRADAIVVLTGGGGRVEYGLDLLAHGRGKALFISGVSKDVPMGDLINKAPMGIRELLGVATLGRITLGHDATNTIGNAEESAQWVVKRKYKTVLLVTADYHMPRALVEFKAEVPPHVNLLPAVVKTHDYRDLAWIHDTTLRSLILSEFHKLVAAKLRHWLIAESKHV
jgi:uncharacterized SAM-binding protein YcdF (DUF218 family)